MVNTKRLRCLIGWLGMALPWIVVGLSLIFDYSFPNSISATYYRAPCITPFMIILGSAGFLLMSYKGYDTFDDIINTCAGIFGLMICLYPCWTSALERVGTFQLSPQISSIIHNLSAVGFFGCLSWNSLFQFTKHGVEEMTKRKKARNVIYRICGCGMIASFALLLLPVSWAVWLMEAVALFFFGISWLTKANCYPWLMDDPIEKT